MSQLVKIETRPVQRQRSERASETCVEPPNVARLPPNDSGAQARPGFWPSPAAPRWAASSMRKRLLQTQPHSAYLKNGEQHATTRPAKPAVDRGRIDAAIPQTDDAAISSVRATSAVVK